VLALSVAAATLTASPSSWSAAWSGGVEVFKITASVGVWRLDPASVPDWLALSPAAAVDRVSGGSQVVRALVNEGVARQATLVFTAGGLTREVVVKQAALPAASVSLSPSSWSAPPEVGSLAVQVTVNRSVWSASADQPWVHVADGPQAAAGVLVLGADPNPTTKSRTATVRVTAGTASKTLKVTQAAGAATRVAAWTASDILDLSATPQQATWPSGLTGYKTLSVSDDATWLTEAVTASTGAVTATAAANTGAARRALVTVKSGRKTLATLVVFQEGAPKLDAGATTWTAPTAGGETTRTVTATTSNNAPQPWQATSDAGWLHATPGDPPSGSPLSLTADPNPTGSTRMATVTITAGEQSTTITITQRA
jgi:hypothetical protein